VKAREGLARALASAKVIAACVKLAATDLRHYREVSQFDRNLWLFNTLDGTIDLKTGELRPHRREDLITKIANATPRGTCPQWMDFLKRVTDDNLELQSYLQRLAGYAMCGDPSEECLDFFYGEGGNGKGTFLKTLQYIFGEYSTTAQTETFLEAKGERHPTDLAKLAGARLVVAQEIDEGQHWNEVRLKTLTGRDEITARFMRRDLFDFIPQFTLIISGNNKPALKTVDEAWRRRFHLIPFEVCIPKAEQNPSLKTELQKEADGILMWCLSGCLEWQRQRLSPPPIVLSATDEYFEAEDTFEMWLAECCLREHLGYQERKAMAYASHRHWKQERGEKPPGMKTFSQRMQKHGFQLGQETSGERARVFQGLRLTDEERRTVKAILEAQKRREQAGTDSPEDYVG
jgi:putative DNA primase/helicase